MAFGIFTFLIGGLKSVVSHDSAYVCRRFATYGDADSNKNIKAEKMEVRMVFIMFGITRMMVIPVDVKKPDDKQVKTGKYIKIKI